VLSPCCASLAPCPGWPIFGLGDIVFDPTNFRRGRTAVASAGAAVRAACPNLPDDPKPVPADALDGQRRSREHGLTLQGLSPLCGSRLRQRIPTARPAPGCLAINSGQGVSAGYSAATTPLAAYGTGFGHIPRRPVRPHQDKLRHGRAYGRGKIWRECKPSARCAAMHPPSKRRSKTWKMILSRLIRT